MWVLQLFRDKEFSWPPVMNCWIVGILVSRSLCRKWLSRPPTHPARVWALVVLRFGTLRRYHAVAHSVCARSAGFGTLRRYHQIKRYLAGTKASTVWLSVFSALVFSQLSIARGDSGSDLDGRGPTRAHKNIVICGVRGGALSHGVFGCSCPWCLDTTSSNAPMQEVTHLKSTLATDVSKLDVGTKVENLQTKLETVRKVKLLFDARFPWQIRGMSAWNRRAVMTSKHQLQSCSRRIWAWWAQTSNLQRARHTFLWVFSNQTSKPRIPKWRWFVIVQSLSWNSVESSSEALHPQANSTHGGSHRTTQNCATRASQTVSTRRFDDTTGAHVGSSANCGLQHFRRESLVRPLREEGTTGVVSIAWYLRYDDGWNPRWRDGNQLTRWRYPCLRRQGHTT